VAVVVAVAVAVVVAAVAVAAVAVVASVAAVAVMALGATEDRSGAVVKFPQRALESFPVRRWKP
jgi:hypothetical protein